MPATEKRSRSRHLLGIEGCVPGGFDEVCDRLGDEGARAAGGVEDGLIQWIGYDLPDHRAGEPVGGVVLAKLASLVGWNDGLV